MNTETGIIFDVDGKPLGENEVELTQKQFRELFPIRTPQERLDRYRQLQQLTNAFKEENEQK